MTTSQTKISLRAEARKKRDSVWRASGTVAAKRIAEIFLKNVTVSTDDIIAGYWPRASELDCRPLLHGLVSNGIPCCLPVVTAPQSPLIFLSWDPSVVLTTGAYGIMVPGGETQARQSTRAPTLVPTLILAPLLAFDRRGYRLGYGGGYYDRTIELIRRRPGGRPMRVIGIAFEAQRVDNVPHDIHDQPLDGAVTEVAYHVFTSATDKN